MEQDMNSLLMKMYEVYGIYASKMVGIDKEELKYDVDFESRSSGRQ